METKDALLIGGGILGAGLIGYLIFKKPSAPATAITSKSTDVPASPTFNKPTVKPSAYSGSAVANNNNTYYADVHDCRGTVSKYYQYSAPDDQTANQMAMQFFDRDIAPNLEEGHVCPCIGLWRYNWDTQDWDDTGLSACGLSFLSYLKGITTMTVTRNQLLADIARVANEYKGNDALIRVLRDLVAGGAGQTNGLSPMIILTAHDAGGGLTLIDDVKVQNDLLTAADFTAFQGGTGNFTISWPAGVLPAMRFADISINSTGSIGSTNDVTAEINKVSAQSVAINTMEGGIAAFATFTMFIYL